MNKTIRTELNIRTINKEYPGALSLEKIKLIEKSINNQKSAEQIIELTKEARTNLLEYLQFSSEKLGMDSFKLVITENKQKEIE